MRSFIKLLTVSTAALFISSCVSVFYYESGVKLESNQFNNQSQGVHRSWLSTKSGKVSQGYRGVIINTVEANIVYSGHPGIFINTTCYSTNNISFGIIIPALIPLFGIGDSGSEQLTIKLAGLDTYDFEKASVSIYLNQDQHDLPKAPKELECNDSSCTIKFNILCEEITDAKLQIDNVFFLSEPYEIEDIRLFDEGRFVYEFGGIN